jgi:hypothetical protein
MSDISLDLYCLCSEKMFSEIFGLQTFAPLPFNEMVEQYTTCNSGCGGCIEKLKERFDAMKLTDFGQYTAKV